MKKLLTLALAVLMCVFAISALADTVSIDRTLELQFVPSKDADVIITGTKNLPELLKAALLEQGYDVKDINITVGTNYEATGEAMAAGTVDLGWLPGGTYALFSDDVDVILTATRAGLSNDSEDPTTWNGEANKTLKNGPQVTFYRSLIYATPSAYGKELAAKVNAGEALTWDDLSKANWAVLKNSSSAGYIYPTLWLQDHYEKKITDLPNVITLAGYGDAFAQAAAEAVDIIVCYADGRNDYEAALDSAHRSVRRNRQGRHGPHRFHLERAECHRRDAGHLQRHRFHHQGERGRLQSGVHRRDAAGAHQRHQHAGRSGDLQRVQPHRLCRCDRR